MYTRHPESHQVFVSRLYKVSTPVDDTRLFGSHLQHRRASKSETNLTENTPIVLSRASVCLDRRGILKQERNMSAIMVLVYLTSQCGAGGEGGVAGCSGWKAEPSDGRSVNAATAGFSTDTGSEYAPSPALRFT